MFSGLGIVQLALAHQEVLIGVAGRCDSMSKSQPGVALICDSSCMVTYLNFSSHAC